jgi:hypothetical protein
MTVAVGRLQFSITMNQQARTVTPPPVETTEDAIQRSARRERHFQDADADRSRWVMNVLARAGRPF